MKWISIKDERPPINKGILVSNGIIVTSVECFDYINEEPQWVPHEVHGYDCELLFDEKSITHWALLPEPPEGVQQ